MFGLVILGSKIGAKKKIQTEDSDSDAEDSVLVLDLVA